MLFELSGVDETLARAAMSRAIQKLPFKARVVVRASAADIRQVEG
jgi:large subunit ribosomal protein L16